MLAIFLSENYSSENYSGRIRDYQQSAVVGPVAPVWVMVISVQPVSLAWLFPVTALAVIVKVAAATV